MNNEAADAGRKFIERTAPLPEYERSQVWAEAMHYSRLGNWDQFPQPLAEWFRQVVNYVDDNGPKPDYWPDTMPW